MQQQFMNPVVHPGADPWLYFHTDGYYYWYIYFTAHDGSGDQGRRVFVLENKEADPYADAWEMKGAVNTALPGLDGTVLQHNDRLYFLYAGYGHYPEYGSAIYISAMSNPWMLTGEERLLTKPEYDWEKNGGMAINEGPVMLKRNGRIFLVYSASTTWSDDYCLGMLTADENGDMMDPSAWHKSAHPVFIKDVEGSVFGPGHNSFTVSSDGAEDWIVYHAFSYSGAGASDRSVRMQTFTWRGNGMPDFGFPAAPGAMALPSGEWGGTR